MAKNTKDVYRAAGSTTLLMFDPDELTLVTDETSPLYDPRVHLPVNENLARNIDYQGILEPISIMKNPETGDVEVVYGRQRVKAARLVNQWRKARGETLMVQVPGTVYKGKRHSALDAIASENEVRQADSPLGRAEKMRQHQAKGYGEDQIAVIYGCSIATVRATIALLDSPAAVREAVESGQINVTHARQLASLPPEDQRAKVEELIQAGTGVRPHERSRKQREVMASNKPRLRSRKEITAELEKRDGAFADALRWVLGLNSEQQQAS
ncbi:ParB/RepB/Spo0J family partition protein [Kerstersia gyiorum]|uniref:ParB/Spo0J HTH domain-containing protein n=1 Tax=Kerstersia gyiorum TaxID=206506 RepID=A0A171KSD6_9BURK|nr:ParB/RepB/Spo0J family partition protein [Kerstersia gyiorum]KKO71803.1 hypothetical protein AAV32_09500 [Kerstersia gyiorum]